MRDVLADIDSWLEAEEQVALATVIQTWGSAPRQAGAKMAMTPDGKITGSVSGGCVEGAVFEAGVQTLENGRPQLLHFGVADETAWEVGLACGGTIEVFVEPLDRDVYEFVHKLLEQERSAAIVTVVRGPAELLGCKLLLDGDGRTMGNLAGEYEETAIAAGRSALVEGKSRRMELPSMQAMMGAGTAETVEVFIEVMVSSPLLVIVGGVHIAIALAALAKVLGYRTVVIDPRRAFGSEARFPHVDRLIQAWPDEAFEQVVLAGETAVALLTHDHKIDDPALKVVLNSPAFYVGALGSNKTQAARRERLAQMGFSQEAINRVHGPIGLEIGAQTPEEIALAVMAEIVKARRAKT
jgi:xanthine dehydrogenase accessory factor